MKFKLLQLLVISGLVAGACTTGYAQAPSQNYADEKEVVFENGTVAIKQKLPSFFKKAKMKPPAKQLEYAENFLKNGKTRAGVGALNDLIHTWPASQLAPKAQLMIALEYEKLGKYERAFNEFQYLINYYPNKFPYDVAIKHQMAIANEVRTSRRWRFLGLPGISNADNSIVMYNQIVQNAPNWDQAPMAELYSCMLQEDNGNYEGAIAGYELLMQQFPDSKRIPEAKFRRLYCLHKLTKIYKRDKQVYLQSMEASAEFIRDYPTNENIEEAKEYYADSKDTLAQMSYEVAAFYDKQKKTTAAIITYQSFLERFPDSKYSNKARKRIVKLKKQGHKK
ncbi:MAG: outer membrane protein assembly factor BamD [Kiritimatiellae bacterium]|jgi:outer membrane assembly lipoprotein YfiO|nr:outer membrane protein assembly factor BamD [Kiritimatiellia bacterium]